MRKNNIIFFTNLGIVKCPEFELTYDLFLSKMRELIENYPDRYGINYDEENDQYEITYNSNKYEVRIGKDGLYEKTDAVEILNTLIKDQENFDKVKSELDKKDVYDREKIEEIFRRARDGILESNEDKYAKIKLEKEQYKTEKHHIFKGMWNTFKNMCVGKRKKGIHKLLFILFGIITTIMVVFAALKIYVIAIGLLLTSLSLYFDGWIHYDGHMDGNYYGFRGFVVGFLAILLTPANLIYNVVKKISKSINHHINIHNIKKTITNFNGEKECKSNVDINKVDKFIDNIVDNSFTNAPTNLESTYEMINDLKDKILLIKDKSVSKKLAMNLYEIIRYYTDASISLKEKKVLPDILYNQITDLNNMVEEELKKEEKQEQLNTECNELIETIHYQKSIGSR